ncbi:ParA family protein [Microbacterium amylolyticum]|uniref:Cellulose biosynthesis protein BcsQ n=1 Tax=Microbacterium amylolyticum TaxID=936337 RepID=A0ABS4ZE26_9MICO|nr:AAA family ATPase [Microbacterium amylolyticum]MBP2435467.1 cellulose biosynthesis protein BcsQ [Microbacterium amylolyticum]
MPPHIITAYSTKGGVGKTTSAVNLAVLAAEEGNRVLLWDLDPQAAATWLLGVKQKLRGGAEAVILGEKSLERATRPTAVRNLEVLPADLSYRDLDVALDGHKRSSARLGRALEPLRDVYDVVILDTPPGVSLVAENAVRASDVVVTPLAPALLSLRSYDQVRAFIATQKTDARLVAFLNQVDRRKRSHRDAATELPARIEGMSDIVVPASVVVERMAERRAALQQFAPRSEAGRAFAALWHTVSRG